MSPVGIRQALHHIYTLVSLVLIATGLLLAEPDLRARLVGGYGRQILDLHLWAGWVFLGVPLLALVLAARPLLRDLWRRLGPPDGITWRKIHIVFSLVTGIVFAATGVLLWLNPRLPLAVIDVMLEIHEVFMWLMIVALAVHLVAAWRKTVTRTREILGRETEPLFSLEDEEELEKSGP
jgi:cytochrome b subunit of formate dehydrogenase